MGQQATHQQEGLRSALMSERAANRRKSAVDRLAGELMGLDGERVGADALDIASRIRKYLGKEQNDPAHLRIVVCGAAGSGKTTLAAALSKHLEIPHFNLDEYIPGGWTPDKSLYRQRRTEGIFKLWQDFPKKSGWVIEHVEAAGEEVRKVFSPRWAILIDPGPERLMRVAEAREQVSGGDTAATRAIRSLESARIASTQFWGAQGSIIFKEGPYSVRLLREG